MSYSYSTKDVESVKNHINSHFGKCNELLCEQLGNNKFVDICAIEPDENRNFYTLLTIGMGAYKMSMPEYAANMGLDRAELLITLPASWDIYSRHENNYWPIRWLTLLAQLPIRHDTWLGWGHTIPAGCQFAENTELSCMLLMSPSSFGQNSCDCKLTDDSVVNFYQLFPIYKEEMEFKLQHGTAKLFDKIGDFSHIVDVNRTKYL